MFERTLRELLHARTVYQVVCQRCRHGAVLYPMDLAQTLGWDCTGDELTKHLRCSKCSSRTVNLYEASR
jgi:hypothetical protein